eukprot:scaffold80617_cov54-Phaeocystis_antarctica.AAC.1
MEHMVAHGANTAASGTCISLVSLLLPGAVPGARVAPGPSDPSELLLHHSVELPLGVTSLFLLSCLEVDRALGGASASAPASLRRHATLALATSWSSIHDVSLHLHRGEPLTWLFLRFEFKYDLCRVKDDHVTAALLAPAAPPPVLAEAGATALLAPAALPPVLAEAGATAILAPAALPPVLANAASAALFADAAFPPMLADTAAAALLALAAHPPVLADAGAAALLALAALPTVLADSGAAALLAMVALPPVFADADAAALLTVPAHPP